MVAFHKITVVFQDQLDFPITQGTQLKYQNDITPQSEEVMRYGADKKTLLQYSETSSDNWIA